MQKTITFILFFIFYFDIAFSDLHNRECIVGSDRDIVRYQFTYPETIQCDNFVVLFTCFAYGLFLISSLDLSLSFLRLFLTSASGLS